MAPPTVTPPATGVDRVSGSEEAGASAGASAANSDVLKVARAANVSSFFTLRLLVGSFLQKEGRLRLARGQCKQKSIGFIGYPLVANQQILPTVVAVRSQLSNLNIR
jgi:hypothetical protein